jgi:hypothetical protein
VLLLLGAIVGGGLLYGFFELSGGELCGILAILLLLHGLPLSALLLQELESRGLSVVGLALLLELLLQPSHLLRLVNPELLFCSFLFKVLLILHTSGIVVHAPLRGLNVALLLLMEIDSLSGQKLQLPLSLCLLL